MMVYEEERRVRIIEEDISIKTKMCEDDLRKAEPALVAAQAALNTLNKTNLTELKSFGSPPKAVVNVCAAVMVLLAPNGKIPRDRGWRAAKLMMGKVDQFLNDLLNYDKDNIPPNVIEVLEEYLKVRDHFHYCSLTIKLLVIYKICKESRFEFPETYVYVCIPSPDSKTVSMLPSITFTHGGAMVQLIESPPRFHFHSLESRFYCEHLYPSLLTNRHQKQFLVP